MTDLMAYAPVPLLLLHQKERDIHDRWRVGPPPCLHRFFVVGVLVLVLSNCNSSDIGQLPVPIVAFRNFDVLVVVVV